MCETWVSFPFCRARLNIRFERGQLAVDLAVRDLPFLPVFTFAKHDHISAPLQNERVDVGRFDRC